VIGYCKDRKTEVLSEAECYYCELGYGCGFFLEPPYTKEQEKGKYENN
jgi:hypothetical protein